MLDSLFKNRAHQQRRLRSQAADLLLRRLEQEQTLRLDDSLVAAFKIGRRALFRIAYDLAAKERMHIMAGPDGAVTLLSNAEFRRFMLRRAGAPEEALPRESAAAESVPMASEETHIIETVEAEPTSLATDVGVLMHLAKTAPNRPPADEDFAWFALDVAPSRAKRGKMPPRRQSLPERARDPWSALEGAGLD